MHLHRTPRSCSYYSTTVSLQLPTSLHSCHVATWLAITPLLTSVSSPPTRRLLMACASPRMTHVYPWCSPRPKRPNVQTNVLNPTGVAISIHSMHIPYSTCNPWRSLMYFNLLSAKICHEWSAKLASNMESLYKE
jgi:hypothetical protein